MAAPTPAGYLRLYVGPMFSGKTSALLHDLITFAAIGQRPVLVMAAEDTRPYVSHNGVCDTILRAIPVRRAKTLAELGDLAEFGVIGIDESQFFEDLVPACERWVGALGKTLVVAGLDGDCYMRPFGATLRLVPLCDDVVKLRAKCMLCLRAMAGTSANPETFSDSWPPQTAGANMRPEPPDDASSRPGFAAPTPPLRLQPRFPLPDAPFTARTVAAREQKLIGGAESYAPVCRYHHAALTTGGIPPCPAPK